MAWSTPVSKTTGDLVTAANWNTNTVDNPNALLPAALEFFIPGGASVIAPGVKGPLEVPFKCDIDGVRLLTDQSGTIQIDIWKDTYGNYLPTNADSITASAEPATSSAIKYTDSTLTGWTTAIADQDILLFNVDASPAPVSHTWCLVVLDVSRS